MKKYIKNPICIDCGKELVSHYALRCKKCNGLYNNSMKGKIPWNKNKLFMVKEENPNWVDFVKVKCFYCNKEFDRKPYRLRKIMFCSRECELKWRSEKYSNEGNSMYNKKHKRKSIELIRMKALGRECTEETKEKHRKNAYKRWENIELKNKILTKTFKNNKKSPNKLEKDFMKFLEENNLSKYKFVGDGKVWIRNRNPDFICKEDRKIIELYGDYWHRNDKNHNDRIKTYVENDYDTLVIYESEFRKDKYNLLKDLIRFEKLEVY